MDDYRIREVVLDCITGMEVQQDDFLLAFITSAFIFIFAIGIVYFIMPIIRENEDKSLTLVEEFKW